MGSPLFNVSWLIYFYGVCILGYTAYSECLARWPKHADAAKFEPHLIRNSKVRVLICTPNDQFFISVSFCISTFAERSKTRGVLLFNEAIGRLSYVVNSEFITRFQCCFIIIASPWR